MIETHAHIYLDEFSADIDLVVNKARESGVDHIFMPNVDETTIDAMLAVERRYPGFCHSMMGLHPCSVDDKFEIKLREVEEWLGKRKFSAVGEIGTDLYWDKTFLEQQKEAFNQQCELALQYHLPVVIHCRDSIDETIALVKPFAEKGLNGVFHCFTGDVRQAQEIIEMDFLLGIGGVVTFKNSGLDKVMAQIGFDRVILETDSPYLAPTPNRGKRNEPGYLHLVAEKLASLFPESNLAEVIDKTSENALKLFNLEPEDGL